MVSQKGQHLRMPRAAVFVAVQFGQHLDSYGALIGRWCPQKGYRSGEARSSGRTLIVADCRNAEAELTITPARHELAQRSRHTPCVVFYIEERRRNPRLIRGSPAPPACLDSFLKAAARGPAGSCGGQGASCTSGGACCTGLYCASSYDNTCQPPPS